MTQKMIVKYGYDADMSYHPEGFIGMRIVYPMVRKVGFCCEKMKEKWMKEVGFCPNQVNQFSYSCDPYLFWTLDFISKSWEFGFLSIIDQYGFKKDKIEECPFCHGKIEFVEVD